MDATVVSMVFEGVAILICLSWIWVNSYHYYPMVVTALESLLQRATGPASTGQDLVANGSQPASPDSLTLTIPEQELPSIDVLLPAYREGSVIEHSIGSIREADYPQDKLTVTVLLEPDDDETTEVLDRIEDDYEFDALTVPPEYPGDQNKPRALNYGFEKISGDVVSITDAEDVVHPKLYRGVAEKLAAGHDYVQGRLDMVNENDGWMNLLFRAEYGYWYLVNTWAKYKRRYPIPLGGTTCFFPRELLETMSERRLEKYEDPWSETDWAWVEDHALQGYRPWDPQNVTEDFELGLFLWQEGYNAGYLRDTPTDEESPLSMHAWVRQRTRWKKGKIYTFFQYLRYPPDTTEGKFHVYTQSAVPHLGPVSLVATAVLLLGANLLGYPLHPITSTVLIAGFLMATVVVALYAYGYWTVSEKPWPMRLRRSTVVALTLPMYWFMQWVADVRALRQTYAGELHWAKTTHFGRNVDPDATAISGTTAYPADGEPTADAENSGWVNTEHLLALASVVFVGVGLRIYGLTDWSLYGDELYSVTSRAALPVRELLMVPLPLDSHPPLYYLLLHYWMDLFGNSVASIRSMSVLLGAGAILIMYALGTELYDSRTGLLAAFLLAISTFHIHYSRVARMYSLFVLLALASWYGFTRLRTRSTSASVVYVVSTALLVYTHVFGLFVVAAQYVYVLLSETNAGLDWRRWAGVQAAVGVLTAPWVARLTFHVWALLTGVREGGIISWVPPPRIGIVTNTVLRYVGWPHNFPLLVESGWSRLVAAVLVVVYVVCAVLAVATYTDDREWQFADISAVGQLSVLLAVPIVVPFLVSYLVTPVYFPRFTIPASLALFLLVAAGITNISARKHQIAVLVVIVACSGVLVGQYHTTSTEADWAASGECLTEGTEPGDLVLYQTFWTQNYVEYYQQSPGVTKRGVLSPDEPTANREYALNLTQVRAAAADHDQVWLFQYQPSAANRLLSTLRETHSITLVRDYGPMYVYRLERAPSPPVTWPTDPYAAEFPGVSAGSCGGAGE
ncbi:glycosyltransferase [Halobacterium zhouii]|uniref:glycosyltransferase n=1 Tax=Halobacterium zhouii TaxID=2902624 RepID=UPI001E5DB2A6|nr:glycosyltransferase [Halobacterium zhouii]